MSWKEVERLIDEQKYREALGIAERLLEGARGGEAGEWTRALVQVAQLESGLHGYERTVRRLREEAWPEDPLSQATLHLFYADGLRLYLEAYSWEIRQRERVISVEEPDLRLWTSDQILAEANRAFSAVWEQREALGEQPVAVLKRYLKINNYPAGIRDTLRDAVTYLWVDLLADSSHWSPKHSGESWRLDLGELLAEEPAAADLTAAKVHPLEKVVTVLSDLERWHLVQGRPQAALEARLERLRRLRATFDHDDDRRLFVEDLQARLDSFDRSLPWWSEGMELLARLVQKGKDSDALIRARELALRGAEAHPDSHGGRRCARRVATIEAPAYTIASMATDGANRRSLRISHRNLARLHLRAYSIDVLAAIERGSDFGLLPAHREVQAILAERAPEHSWSVDLPETVDYRSHTTYIVPPFEQAGMYLVVASAEEEFGEEENHLQAVYLNLSDLVLVSSPGEDGLEACVRSGGDGRALPGVEVRLYLYGYGRRGHRHLSTETTDGKGCVQLGTVETQRHFVVAKHGREVALQPHAQLFHHRDDERRRGTKRCIYRP